MSMKMGDWLRGMVKFSLSDDNVNAILLNRGLTYDQDALLVAEREKDLSRADALTLYISAANQGSSSWKDGGSSETTPGESFTYKDEAKGMAIYLYGKWGVEIPLGLGARVKSVTHLW